MEDRHCWDRSLGLGREKIFQVRASHNDLTFLDEFLTLDFCVEHDLFSFGFNARNKRWEIVSREFADVKAALLLQLTNAGQPIVNVADGNFENTGELLLVHRHEGLDLDPAWSAETLAALARIWSRPANIITEREGKSVRLRHDGHELQHFDA